MVTHGSFRRFASALVALGLGAAGLVAIGTAASAAPPCDPPTANAIVAENCLPGNPASEWDVSGAGDASIQGFATDISVNRGQTVHFKVDTDATDYDIDIYRLGWYGGDGARHIAHVDPSAPLPQTQPDCLEDSTGLVDCGNWAESASWAVPGTAVSGVYIARLHRAEAAPDAGASHMIFIVRDDASHSNLLFQTSDTTWQAYNSYGGNSLYTGAPAGRAYKVSYNRPFNSRANTPEDWVFNAEWPMIRWIESNGYDVSYISGVDTDRSGALLQQHDVFMSVGHDEYWSGQQRTNVEAARDAGVHLAFFSGNESFWKTRWEPSLDPSNTDHRTLVSYKETHDNMRTDPTETWTGTWRDTRFGPHDGGRPENGLTGTIFTVNCCTYTMKVPEPDGNLRFWRNTSVAAATSGVQSLADSSLGYEWDEDLDNGSRPAGQIELSSTTQAVSQKLLDNGSTYGPGTATHALTLHRAASGALVFGAGTVQWSWGLDGTHDRGGSTPSPAMRQATVNLFADMGVQPAALQAGLTAATASTDTVPPTAAISSPGGGSTVTTGTPVTVTGTATDTNGLVGGVEVSTDDGASWHPATGRQNWSYTFTPSTPGAIALRARATDDSVNTGVQTAAVALTVEPGGPGACCSLWDDTATPAQPTENDGQPIEPGTRFTSEIDGTVTAVRFYKGAGTTGAHTGHLWSAGGALLGTATFTSETASGWQQAALSTPVAITAGTEYIVSSFSANGFYAFTGGYFNGSDHDNAPLHAPQDSVDAHNGVYNFGASGFPTSSFGSANYWVDLVFEAGPDTTPPTITSHVPTTNATNVALNAKVRATSDDSLDAGTVDASSFELRDGTNALVPATVSYESGTRTAVLTPSAPLAPSSVYTATLHGGAAGVTNTAGLSLAGNVTWSFTTTAPPPPDGPGGPILVVTSTANPFAGYLAEILRAEGLNEYRTTDITAVNAALLDDYDVVLLGQMPLTSTQAAMFGTFVTNGGNLVAMRPDSDLAGLLGLTDDHATLTNGYLQVATGTQPGQGITGQSIQFHGTADRYSLSGATSVATLFEDAHMQTTNPAVTLRSVGILGGQAAAFTYDLARSVVYTRQGNPAWSGQERDGTPPIRSDDLFFGSGSEDPQPDWVDLTKVQIPQADEQQRLLANLVLQMEQDRAPLPRFWYLPRGEKAAVIMTGDDHASGGTAGRFAAEAAQSPPGCSVANWECLRSTSYVYTGSPLTPAEANTYTSQGFEVALHVNTNCEDWTPASLDNTYSSQLDGWQVKYAAVPAPVTNRTHCIVWSDYDTQPQVELAHGIRLDTNYYYWPASWILDRPGLFTGTGFPQRFATANGDLIDVYQATTQMTDESSQSYPATINTLLDNATGPLGYYGAFTANMHTDSAAHDGWSAIIASAQAHDVPVVSAKQMLDWLDGRNSSAFGAISFAGNVLDFTVTRDARANGLQTMVPATTASGAVVSSITRNGSPVTFATETRKGVDYAAFDAPSGSYVVTYTLDEAAPTISSVVATAGAGGTATVTWTTDEAASSRVDYGTSAGSLSSSSSSSALVTSHSRTLTGLTPGATYFYRVTSADAHDNAAVSPAPPSGPASFTLPAFVGVDTTATTFATGTLGACRVVSNSGDGAVTLKPTEGSDFNGASLPAGWGSSPWPGGGSGTVGGGQLTVDGAFTATNTFYAAGRSLEFVATFQPTPFQHVGFADDLNNSALWAIFSTGGDGTTLKTRTNNNGATDDRVIPGSWLGTPHRFRIDWTASQVVFSIDGSVVATHAAAIAASMRPAVSDLTVGGPAVTVDWLDMTPYTPSPCTYQSHTFDAGAGVHWTTLDRVATTPAGTTLTIETRTSADGSGWSPFVALSGNTIASPDNRYLQYHATLTTSVAGNTPALEAVTVTAAPETVAPVTSMLIPSGGAALRGNSVVVDASASDNIGVTSVEFRITGGALDDFVVGSGALTIYGWLGFWDTTAVPNGTYTLRSVARDAAGNTGTSAPITITVDNAPPSSSVVVPANGASVRGTSVALAAAASDNVGVTKVEFRATGGSLNDALLGTGNISAFGWIYVWNSDAVAAGPYTLRATAFDAAGNATVSAPITITVDRTAPTASLVLPANGASVKGTAVALRATATDNVGVTKVEFRATGGSLNDALLGTGTNSAQGWNLAWNSDAVAAGSYTLRATAFDGAGNSTVSAPITITVDRTAPTASVVLPANGASVKGTAVALRATATDNVAVTKVEFRATGGSLNNALLGTGTNSAQGWNLAWNSDAVAVGTYVLRATAFDGAGNSTVSAPITINVDRTAPTASVVLPANGASVKGTVALRATATDNVGVTKVEFRATGGSLNNALLGTGTNSAQGWNFAWNSDAVAIGSYTLRATAFDAAGNSKVSAQITITVDRTAPTSNIVVPAANGAVLSGTAAALSATAADSVGVTKVEFRVTGTASGSTVTNLLVGTGTFANNRWSTTFNTNVVPNGPYQLRSVAFDAAGNSAMSGVRTVTVSH